MSHKSASNWELISAEAEKVARLMQQKAVDLAEAEKAGDYFLDHEFAEEKMARYLALLATNPPVRSNSSIRHYRNIRQIWQEWQTELTDRDKARAWSWAVRLAKTQR